jgi:plastocyanin
MTAGAPSGRANPAVRRLGALLLAAGVALPLVAWLLVSGGGGSGLDGAGPPGGHRFDPVATPVVVRVFEYGFNPSNVTIVAGQGIAWQDVGDDLHTITPRSAAGREVWLQAQRRGSAVQVFRRPGVYPYYCSRHPWMRGTVTVRRSWAHAGSTQIEKRAT